MAADVFGDSSLFSEFDKDRESRGFLNNSEVKNTEEPIEVDGDKLDVSGNGDECSKSDDNSDSESVDKLSLSPHSDSIIDEESTVITCKVDAETSSHPSHRTHKSERMKWQSSRKHVPVEESPKLEVVFHNNDFTSKYRYEIEAFIENLIERENYDDNKNRSESQPPRRTGDVGDIIMSNIQFYRNFMVDRLGCNLKQHITESSCICNGIRYEQIFTVPLPVDEEDLIIIKREQKKKSQCFNCDGEHNLADCPEPKDQNKIRENRRKFQNSSVPKLSLTKNYSDFEDNPRFKKFAPGKMSDELCSAMGINRTRLPSYIYRMRMSGYPPGWMVSAKKGFMSGMKIFDKEGKETNLKGETLEDGEINAEGAADPQLEVDKIIEYPGFTVPVPEGVIDEWERYNMPPLQQHQLKVTLVRQVSLQEDVKKRKAEEEEKVELKRIRLVNKEADMELSDNDDTDDVIEISDEMSGADSDFPPPLPVDTPPNKPPLPVGTPPVTPIAQRRHLYHPTLGNLTPPNPPLPDTSPCRPPIPDGTPPQTPVGLATKRTQSMDSGGNNSPSFETLEAQHQRILEELNDEGNSQSEVEVIEITEESDSSSNQTYVRPTSEISKKTMSRANSTLSVQSLDDSGLARGNSLVIEYGTPILATSSSAAILPNRENFKQGTEDHLLFENLPGATGTFSKMRQLLGKIKSKLGKK